MVISEVKHRTLSSTALSNHLPTSDFVYVSRVINNCAVNNMGIDVLLVDSGTGFTRFVV